MPRTLPVILMVMVLLLSARDYCFADVDLRADYSYQQSTRESDGVKTSTSSFNQTYLLAVRKPITSTINLFGDIRWTIIETDKERTTSVYPVFTLDFNPPALYNVRAGYSRTESAPSERERITSANTHAAFALPETRWPSLVISANRSTTQDHETPRQMDTASTYLTLNAGYTLNVYGARTLLNYSFTDTFSKDKVSAVESMSPSHLASVNFSRSFMAGKINSNGNLGYQLSETTSESTGGPTRFEQRVLANTGLSFFDAADPLSVILDEESELIDNNIATPVAPSINLNDADWNIGLGFSSDEAVFKIYIIVNTTEDEEINIRDVYDFNWNLYTSSDNITWTSLGGITPAYNTFFNRFEFTFTETTARFFKLVNGAGNGVDPIEVTEIAAFGFALSSPRQSFTSSSTREFGGFNVSYTPVERLNVGFSLNIDHSSREAEGGQSAETTNSRYGTNLGYIVFPEYLTFSTAYTSSRSETRGETGGNNHYSFTLSSRPLDTLNGSFTYSRSESIIDSEKTSQNDSMGVNVGMNIYTGIELGLGTSFGTTKNLSQDSESSSRNFRWNLRLVPWQTLTTTINGSVSSSETTKEGVTAETSSESTGLTFSFAPTRKVHASGSIDITPETAQTYALSWLPTRHVQFGVRFNTAKDTTGAGGTFNWRPFQILSFSTGYNIAWRTDLTNDKSETFFARASFVF